MAPAAEDFGALTHLQDRNGKPPCLLAPLSTAPTSNAPTSATPTSAARPYGRWQRPFPCPRSAASACVPGKGSYFRRPVSPFADITPDDPARADELEVGSAATRDSGQTSTAAPQMLQASNSRRFRRATGTKNTVNCLNSRIRVCWVVLWQRGQVRVSPGPGCCCFVPLRKDRRSGRRSNDLRGRPEAR
jgi:hypothetical protein